MSVKRNMISDYMNSVAIGYTGRDYKHTDNEKLILTHTKKVQFSLTNYVKVSSKE